MSKDPHPHGNIYDIDDYDARHDTPESVFHWLDIGYKREGDKLLVFNDLDLSNRNLTHLPDLRNVIVRGNFICRQNKLRSLEGSPYEIRGNFDCSNNPIHTLQGGPQHVRGAYWCRSNGLSSLAGMPEDFGSQEGDSGKIFAGMNPIASLEGLPVKFREFECDNLDGHPYFMPDGIAERWKPTARSWHHRLLGVAGEADGADDHVSPSPHGKSRGTSQR